ncbi:MULTISPECIES: hypothetical protein [unclassified Undibacterium]|uniref:hypothetical protein n=1 Tax=unclassified Undibacterium TaxID=2630295 RepID=UPI002AC8D4C9|nr:MULTISPECIES: hypothetical protein [unclassified Undibacterium]MEB0139978.1 hypothetical protein [Undibacterium sp. CCC2.1]MEB0172998.1 hypothetical protein [Undibacterium sp. CCC1.1]MEB0176848.1 hypothetical protein [Undibacterium sp. CCC3.4]MEB0216080.1 hypothetical protein [Undibacterium sp. 5I2]WPX42226.1 hypothetical protein RHM61_12565 [Undibacterium sp. CCC3.4]
MPQTPVRNATTALYLEPGTTAIDISQLWVKQPATDKRSESSADTSNDLQVHMEKLPAETMFQLRMLDSQLESGDQEAHLLEDRTNNVIFLQEKHGRGRIIFFLPPGMRLQLDAAQQAQQTCLTVKLIAMHAMAAQVPTLRATNAANIRFPAGGRHKRADQDPSCGKLFSPAKNQRLSLAETGISMIENKLLNCRLDDLTTIKETLQLYDSYLKRYPSPHTKEEAIITHMDRVLHNKALDLVDELSSRNLPDHYLAIRLYRAIKVKDEALFMHIKQKADYLSRYEKMQKQPQNDAEFYAAYQAVSALKGEFFDISYDLGIHYREITSLYDVIEQNYKNTLATTPLLSTVFSETNAAHLHELRYGPPETLPPPLAYGFLPGSVPGDTVFRVRVKDYDNAAPYLSYPNSIAEADRLSAFPTISSWGWIDWRCQGMPENKVALIKKMLQEDVHRWISNEGEVAAKEMDELMQVSLPLYGPSRGQSVYAKKALKAFQVLGFYGGTLIKYGSAAEHSEVAKHGLEVVTAYRMDVKNPNYYISAYPDGNMLKKINSAHPDITLPKAKEWQSKTNNLTPIQVGQYHIIYIAIDDIAAGSELLLPYGPAYRL